MPRAVYDNIFTRTLTQPPHQWKYWGQKYHFAPSPGLIISVIENFIKRIVKICLKSTIKPLKLTWNTTNIQFFARFAENFVVKPIIASSPKWKDSLKNSYNMMQKTWSKSSTSQCTKPLNIQPKYCFAVRFVQKLYNISRFCSSLPKFMEIARILKIWAITETLLKFVKYLPK